MTGADAKVPIRKLLIGFVDHVSDPGSGVVVGEESAECAVDGWFGREKGVEVETPTECCVNHGDGSVSGVHSADDPQILWERERSVGVLEIGGLVPVFKEEEQFAEHFGQVCSVDFVDHHDVPVVRVLSGVIGEGFESAVTKLELSGGGGSPAFNEIFISIGGVELDEFRCASSGSEMVGEFACDVCPVPGGP